MKLKKLALISLLGVVALAGCRKDDSSRDDTSSDVDVIENLADGVRNFVNNPIEDRSEILRLLEKYTLENFLGGIPYRDNSGFVLYHDRLEIPADDYVVGYGFGVGEALITEGLEHVEITPAHKMYYHSWQSEDPGTINYMNAQDSVTSDLYSMVTGSYWSTKFNDDKTGYEWYPLLAKDAERPVPLNLDPDTGMGTKWKVPVHVGGDLKYSTLSDVPAIKAFDGRAVALEDYLTPFKLMLDNKWFRATDLGSYSSGFAGVTAYMNAAEGVKNWEGVGIQVDESDNSLVFTFNSAKTPFKAMYSLSSSLFSPIPMDFITAIGGAAEYGKPNVDSVLSIGAYTLELWENDKEVVFKKNPRYIEADKYTHEGYVYTILEDNNVAFQEFLDGKLDSAGVPPAQLDSYKTDPRARQTVGDTVWKLQVNGADEALWDQLFGEEGSVSPGSEWDLKPVMSNRDFLYGLYFSLDREELALSTGSRPAQAFLSENYMIDAEAGVSWRLSDEGKAVTEDLLPERFGYSTALAGEFFRDAMEDLIAAGKYVRGTNTDPTKIELGLHFQTESQIDAEGAVLARMIEGTFNAAVPGFELKLDMYATAHWQDPYYAAMDGEFDMAFGSISGNPLDPIDFLDTVRSDNSSGFTLSWGTDTSKPSRDLEFKGEVYAFDALQRAGLGLTVVEDGEEAMLLDLNKFSWSRNPDGSLALDASGVFYNGDPDYVIEPDEDGLNVNGFPFMGLALFDGAGDFIGAIGLEATKFENGVWEVKDFEMPDLDDYGVIYVDAYINTIHTYGKTVELKTDVFEFIWPYIKPAAAA
ncbi:MAG TPA: ABC transporter substrate-binding protein [Bacilli bacterium]|nr:ABC transporter substrate-binding protein [Bacilli bacterium]